MSRRAKKSAGVVKPASNELLEYFGLLIASERDGDEGEVVSIMRGVCLAVLERAKRAPEFGQGKHEMSGRQWLADKVTVKRARQRKETLKVRARRRKEVLKLRARRSKEALKAYDKAKGLTADELARRAAEQIKQETGTRLSIPDMLDRMSRKEPRRRKSRGKTQRNAGQKTAR